MAWGVTFRGYALDSTNGVAITNISENASMNVREQKLKEGGASLDLLSLASRSITITGKVTGDTSSNFYTHLRNLQAKLNDPSEGTLVLDTYTLPCVAIPGQITYGPNILSANFSCRFVSENKFWRSASTTGASSSAFGTSGTASVTGTITYNANYAPTSPSWTLQNNEGSTVTGLDLTIEDTTNSQAFKVYNMDLGASDVVTIDPSAGQVYISTSSSGASKPPQKVDGAFWDISGASVAFSATVNTTSLSTGVVLGYSYYTNHYSFSG